ncbi:helix-turn-helix domain-containing protein [Lactobacillus sp. ESL0261]|uniref:helix-turn-helix domain-containing protein n=1 Tax=Lactobacillus sp. ESL0261 TaxID=2069348 RepID=UPI000EFB70E1|nr:helix-turn-helix transcriptional regulator [Lactobacillus sp. ESL0261]RMC53252.1 helix-turn-helix domain-containing protein [Lactobacillus sp. ESL0261]
MNYIGKKLKSLRQELGLTQTEMAAGVISVSFYSKVERGLNDIGVNDFLDILQEHNVDPKDFFNDFKSKKANKEKLVSLVNRFVTVSTEDNESEIKNIIKSFEKIKPQTPFIKFIILLARLIAETHNETAMKKLTNKQRNTIKNIIFKESYNDDEYYRILLIANLIQVYNVDEATFFVKSILRRYHDITKVDKKTEIALSVLLINYVDWCFKKKEFKLCKESLDYIKQLPDDIELAFPKILGLYFDELIHGNKEKAEVVKKVLYESGYKVMVKRMEK